MPKYYCKKGDTGLFISMNHNIKLEIKVHIYVAIGKSQFLTGRTHPLNGE